MKGLLNAATPGVLEGPDQALLFFDFVGRAHLYYLMLSVLGDRNC